MTMQPAYGCGTNTGCQRGNNQDRYLAVPELGLWLVADGMGGHESGEVASEIVVDQVCQAIAQGLGIKQALELAHQAVLDAPARGQGQPGMGSTVVSLFLTGNRYECAWVGDSRAYLWNGHTLSQLTRDHSLVQQMIDDGTISEQEAEFHPQRNVITQAIGSAQPDGIHIDSVCGELYPDECILLCSDGLTDEVPLNELQTIFRKNPTVQTTADHLIDAALDHGGSDNVSVIVISTPMTAPDIPEK